MINTTPLTQYAQLLKAAELSQQKEVKIPMQQARLLNVALVELLDKVNQDYESMFNSLKGNTGNDVISVSMDGGGFSDN
jgi:hypothetical protein